MKEPCLLGFVPQPSLQNSFRNVDDCFWPSGQSFLPGLLNTVASVRRLTDAPLVLGGVGYSIFPRRIIATTGADFGIHGDGERAIIDLIRALHGEESTLE